MDYLICKQNFKRLDYTIFEEGETYKYFDDFYAYHTRIFVFYDEFATDNTKRGYTFYKNKEDNNFLISDYFCTLQEFRKLKLKKLNEI